MTITHGGPPSDHGGGGGGGGSKPVCTCSVTSSSIQAGVVAGQPVTVTVQDAGTVVLTRDAANDGPDRRHRHPEPGLDGSANTPRGPQVIHIGTYASECGLSRQ